MNTLVLYDSKFGNTERIAGAIARGLTPWGAVQVVCVTDAVAATQALAGRPDLVLIGGPTQNHGQSRGLKTFLGQFKAGAEVQAAAAFDTRYRGSSWLMGSAANDTAKGLRQRGARLIASPESFFIERRGRVEQQQLEPGEIDRAEAWGRELGKAVGDGRSA